MSQLLALYPGTFDPVTHGHLDLIHRGAALFDALEVSVVRGGPDTLFTREERVALLEPLVADLENVSVVVFDGLLVEHARRRGAQVLLRGVRGVGDLEYELQMAFANRTMAPEIESVFLPPAPEVARISASLVREVASLGGDVSAWVPPSVATAIAAKTTR